MKIPELSTIKTIRKQIGIKQTELAKASGVSQSLIARVESGKVDPTYSKVKKIFLALETLGKGKTPTASHVMNKKLYFIKENQSVREAAALMKKRDISQLPVIINGKITGSITEKNILERIANHDIRNLANIQVKDIMESSFPTIDKDLPLSIVSMLLEYNNAILVMEKGRTIGIITKADMLKLLHR